jgi:hypothetical protein
MTPSFEGIQAAVASLEYHNTKSIKTRFVKYIQSHYKTAASIGELTHIKTSDIIRSAWHMKEKSNGFCNDILDEQEASRMAESEQKAVTSHGAEYDLAIEDTDGLDTGSGIDAHASLGAYDS